MFDTWKLKKRLDSMEETLDTLQGALQRIELEWINAYAKFKKIAGRIARESAVIESREATTEEETGLGTRSIAGNDGTVQAAGGLLTPRQKALQQQILQRRAGMRQ